MGILLYHMKYPYVLVSYGEATEKKGFFSVPQDPYEIHIFSCCIIFFYLSLFHLLTSPFLGSICIYENI